MQVRHRRVLAGGLIASAAVTLAISAPAAQQPPKPSQPPNIQAVVDAAYAKYRTLKEGKNADYIPALAKVDPNLFGIAVVTPDGATVTGRLLSHDTFTVQMIDTTEQLRSFAKADLREHGFGRFLRGRPREGGDGVYRSGGVLRALCRKTHWRIGLGPDGERAR